MYSFHLSRYKVFATCILFLCSLHLSCGLFLATAGAGETTAAEEDADLSSLGFAMALGGSGGGAAGSSAAGEGEGGGSGGGGTSTHTVSVTVSGLSGSGLVLRNNGGDDLAIGANGSFTFATALNDGAAYAVTVATQPTGPIQVCSVSAGSGTISGADVTGVTVVCSTDTYTVRVTVTAYWPFSTTDLVVQNNGTDNMTLTGAFSYTFATPVANGSPYNVTVLTQPSGPGQFCTVTNGSGTISGANVTNVLINCVRTYSLTVGVVNTGYFPFGDTIVLQNNGSDNVSVTNLVGATFNTEVPTGSTYSVTILSQSGSPHCIMENASGTMPSHNTSVTLRCDKRNVYYAGTGLMWPRCLAGQDWRFSSSDCTQSGSWPLYNATVTTYCASNDNFCNGGTNTGTLDPIGVSTVYDSCLNLTWGGYTDWRVPTLAELKTLITCSNGPATPLPDGDACNAGSTVPAINTTDFLFEWDFVPSRPAQESISTTLHWGVNVETGRSGSHGKTQNTLTHCVRTP